jgi:hypothetical protein
LLLLLEEEKEGTEYQNIACNVRGKDGIKG